MREDNNLLICKLKWGEKMKFANTLKDIFKSLLWDFHDVAIAPFRFPHSNWKIDITDDKVIYNLKIPDAKKEDIELEMRGNTMWVKIKDENTDNGKIIFDRLSLPYDITDNLIIAHFNDNISFEHSGFFTRFFRGYTINFDSFYFGNMIWNNS